MNVQRLLIALVPAAAVAAGNFLVVGWLRGEPGCLACAAWLVLAPFVLALLIAFVVARSEAGPVAESALAAPPAEPNAAAALRLLGLLQEEGRFIDFLSEDLARYPDAQIGAAARGIHEGCRKALGERVALEPVLRAAEGETVTVEPGFDPATIRLTGNVSGVPPFRGVLRHAGWRVTRAALPGRPGQDPHIIAPAEVEIQ